MPRILSRSLLLSRRHHSSSSKRVGGGSKQQQDAAESCSRRKSTTSPRQGNIAKHNMMDGIPRVPSDNWGQFVEIASPRTSFSDFGTIYKMMYPRPLPLLGLAHLLDEKVKLGDCYFNRTKLPNECYASLCQFIMTKKWSIRWMIQSHVCTYGNTKSDGCCYGMYI